MANKKISGPVVLIGDSITEAFKTNELLPHFNIINKGVYGDYTEGVYTRLQNDVIAENPAAVFVLIGTNDMARERSDDEIIASVTRIALTLKKQLPLSIIVLTSILPTRDIENRPNSRINRLNMRIKLLTEEIRIKYFDLNQHFTDDDGNLLAYFTTDGLHISDAGYEHWASILKIHIISQLFGDEPEPVNN